VVRRGFAAWNVGDMDAPVCEIALHTARPSPSRPAERSSAPSLIATSSDASRVSSWLEQVDGVAALAHRHETLAWDDEQQ